MSIDIDAIRSRAEFSADPFHAEDVNDLLAELDKVRAELAEYAEGNQRVAAALVKATAQLAKPCGSCHPCTNYRDETWRAAGRTPPHVIEWDDAQAELKALREVAEAAKVWRAQFEKPTKLPRMAALIAAVDALPNPADHLDICPGYGCPGCRETEAGR
ncbi:MAG: hypothetical protein WA890_18555 [Micromonospora sp.]